MLLSQADKRKKVSGADMLSGILLALSYEKCPIDIRPYASDNTKEHLKISWVELGELIDKLSVELDVQFKPLTPGSAKQYLHALRRGHRANRMGDLPPLDVTFSEKKMELKIPKRDYETDKEIYSDVFPRWIFKESV